MIGGVTFEKERHIYRNADGVQIPSVSTILQEMFPPKFPWPEGAAERGTRGHAATEYYDEGDLDESTLDTDSTAYLEGWKRFRAETSFKPTMIEVIVYQELHKYAGTIDRLGTFPDKKKTLLDIKTGVPLPLHALQLMAYALCLDEPHERYCVYLTKKGTYKLVKHSDREDRRVWEAALTTYNWKKKNNLL